MKILRPVLAVISAVLILNIFCFFYYNPGIQISSEGITDATDYVREPYHFSSRLNEGFSSARADRNGYNNIDELISEKTDILLMGSSHIEGYNVAQDETISSLLSEKFTAGENPLYAYNIGCSSQNIYTNVQNLEAAILEYSPSYVVMEINHTLSENQLSKAIAGNYPKVNVVTSGPAYQLQKIPLFKATYSQLKKLMGDAGIVRELVKDPISAIKKMLSTSKSPSSKSELDLTAQQRAAELMISYLNDIATKQDVKIILINHPVLEISKDGGASLSADDEKYFSVLSDTTEDYPAVSFLDLSDRFLAEYSQNHLLQHGFSNSQIGEGHINKYGHSQMADELYKVIIALEEY